MFWKNFSSVFVPLFILVPIAAGWYRYKSRPLYMKIIWLYLLLTGLINTAATITGRVFHTNNSPITHVYTAIEMLMIIWFYKNLLQVKSPARQYFFLQMAFVAVCIINSVFFQSIYTYNSYTRSVESIICMLFALNYFAKIASADGKVLKDAGFYFNTGIFLYFSGAFMLFVFSNFLVYKLIKTDFLIIWNIHACLVVLMYVFFTTGFCLNKKDG